MRGRVIGVVAASMLALAGSVPSFAQELVKDPGTIGFCLCEREITNGLLDSLHQRQQSYEASQKALAALDSDLAASRARINVMSSADIDAYKQLLQRRDAAAAEATTAAQAYDAALTRYNQAYSDYTGSCGGKSFDQTVYNTVQATLSCPKQ